MFWWQRRRAATFNGATPNLSLNGSQWLIAAKRDTDHTTGQGQVAVTGRFESKRESFSVDASYAIDNTNTVYGSYGVTDEKITSVGLETAFAMFGRRNTLDMTYFPPKDSGALKLSIRQGKVKASTTVSFDNLRSKNVSDHAERYEIDAKLSGTEAVKMAYNAKTHAAKCKLSKKLDSRNRIDAEYNYVNNNTRFLSMTFKHVYTEKHAFAINTNYGSRRYNVEWEYDSDHGPWTVVTSFPFNVSPKKGDWIIKRRLEF